MSSDTDPLRPPTAVTFGGGALDRAAHLRGDAAALAAQLAHPDARVLPIWHGKPLILGPARDRLGLLPTNHPALAAASEAAVFLGQDQGAPRFAVDLDRWQPEDAEAVPADGYADRSEQVHPAVAEPHGFRDLRRSMTRLSATEAELAAAARAVLAWHARHRFCANCGHPTDMVEAGWVRHCPNCGARHFPRTDPVVIMLVTRGDRVLVGGSPRFPEGMFSLLAGFVEPGETLEAAVRREVAEEAGVAVGRVGYLLSQPWPFPASLMVACRAEALSEAIDIDEVEIAEARWVDRAEMLEALAGRHREVAAARPGAVARHVLMLWVAGRVPEAWPCM